MKKLDILITKSSKDYELIDSGNGEKLERFGEIILSRPDPQAFWNKRLDNEWKDSDADFIRNENTGKWNIKNNKDFTKWKIKFSELNFWIKPTAFKHTGLFPEQAVNWDWMRSIIKKEKEFNKNIQVLNLFAYTGGASLACAQAGANVVHIDGSKSAMNWARENAEISGLSLKPIRWILEDARVFVNREIKRNNKYDAIIMDPPIFGHGANKEIWKIEEDLLSLIESCVSLLNNKPIFFLINGYSSGYSSIAYENVLKVFMEKFDGIIESGELAIEERKAPNKEERLLPCGIFARWNKR